MAETKRGEDIDEILARIRQEAERRQAESDDGAGRPADWAMRHGGARRDWRPAITIPALPEADEGETVETGKARYHVADFLSLTDTAFLKSAYRVVLGREPDRPGHDSLMAALASGGTSRAQVLSGLMRSEEARGREVAIDGLKKRRLLDIAMRLPLVDMVAMTRRLSAADRRHKRMADAMNEALSAIRRTLREVDMTARAASETAGEALDTSHAASAAMEASRTMLTERSRDLSRLIDEARGAGGERPAAAALDAIEAHAHDELYVAFENRFRGSTEEIARRSERYLPVIRQLAPVAAGKAVLDVGCGRGEWLTQLKARGVNARGVDLNVAMVEQARAAGHTVDAGDVVAVLRTLKDESLGAITGFHIIEHLPFPVLVALLDEARRVLAPGGAILFETPNPECMVVGAYSFYLDPTHRNPLPPEFTRFLAEARGFADSRIVRREADLDLERPESGFEPREITDWFQVPMDYALIAFKRADGPADASGEA
jgi:2-polyprenyl-3-methyl-5-hydroxy-6-metoxy-1,4-benzoquinol methylase